MLHLTHLLTISFIYQTYCFLNSAGITANRRNGLARFSSILRDTIESYEGDLDESSLLQQALARASISVESDGVWLREMSSLPFSCTGCGKCCKVKGEVYLAPMETVAVANYLGLSLEQFKHKYIAQEEFNPLQNHSNHTGWTVLRNIESHGCIFLDENKMCKIYDVRPLQCVSYPFWPQIMLSPQAWNDEVVMSQINDSITTQSSNDGVEPRIWTFERGGCEGMQRINSKESYSIEGVPVKNAKDMLDSYNRYKRAFPVGRPFRFI